MSRLLREAIREVLRGSHLIQEAAPKGGKSKKLPKKPKTDKPSGSSDKPPEGKEKTYYTETLQFLVANKDKLLSLGDELHFTDLPGTDILNTPGMHALMTAAKSIDEQYAQHGSDKLNNCLLAASALVYQGAVTSQVGELDYGRGQDIVGGMFPGGSSNESVSFRLSLKSMLLNESFGTGYFIRRARNQAAAQAMEEELKALLRTSPDINANSKVDDIVSGTQEIDLPEVGGKVRLRSWIKSKMLDGLPLHEIESIDKDVVEWVDNFVTKVSATTPTRDWITNHSLGDVLDTAASRAGTGTSRMTIEEFGARYVPSTSPAPVINFQRKLEQLFNETELEKQFDAKAKSAVADVVKEKKTPGPMAQAARQVAAAAEQQAAQSVVTGGTRAVERFGKVGTGLISGLLTAVGGGAVSGGLDLLNTPEDPDWLESDAAKQLGGTPEAFNRKLKIEFDKAQRNNFYDQIEQFATPMYGNKDAMQQDLIAMARIVRDLP